MLVNVRAPATSANLGSGFDSLGLALDLWASVKVESLKGPRRQAQSVARLVQQGVDAVFGGPAKAPNIHVEWDAAIPLARGLGASAALRAAGLLAGNALLDNLHDNATLLEMGTKLEGHPDNMAPALFGGLQVVVHTSEGVLHLATPVPDDLRVVVFVPDFEMPTQESRRRLPQLLSREDTVFNVGRAALLVAALNGGRYDLLDEATHDRIHQPARAEIFAGLVPIMSAAKDAGAAAAYLSGGGSTVAAFVREDEERVARLMMQAAIAHGFSGRSIIARPSASGAHIEA
jgi:homoserine kinase